MKVLLPIFLLLATCAVFPQHVSAAELSYSQEADGITIRIDGELFTRYRTQSGPRPVLWPIVGPTGKEMTRAYSVSDARPDEEKDHVHHRSMWVGYEGLNGNDLWHDYEPERKRTYPPGKTLHREFTTIDSDGKTVTIATKNDWVSKSDELICQDERLLTFAANEDQRWIDFEIVLTAANGDLNIGDSKEGFFALRVAPSMRADAKPGGRFVISDGKEGTDAWGKHAAWCDYNGPIDEQTVGIAILSHPSSEVAAPRWHVRPYGLFAANPFGELAFTGTKLKVADRPMQKTIADGESITFLYRVIFHRGDEKTAKIAEQFASYASETMD